MTTLSWPSEAVPESVLSALTGPGAPFELLEEDVLGAPMLVFAQRPRSLVELLRGAAERMGDRPYVIFPDRQYTFASILQPIAAVAAALRDEYGVGPGDRVAIVAPNTVEYALTFWATTALGAITVGLNGWWTGEEMAYAVELTEPKVLLGDRRRLARLDGVDLADGLPVLEYERDFPALEAHAPDAELPDVAIDEDDPFVILFTSGTTGRPKGVMLSHRSNIHFLMASMLNGAVALLTDLENGVPITPPAENPVIISAAPMFHIAGLNCQLVMSTLTNMTIVYPPPGKWREETHLELTQQHGATTWALVPTQLWRILDDPALDRYDTSSVRNVGGGSAVWPPELLRTLAERIPTAKAGTALGYGSTETTGLGTTLRPGLLLEHADSIGTASATMQVQVRDPETDKPLPEGEVGEICVRGGSCFLGYWRNPEATARALDADRWYRTGDFGVIRDGYVHLEGRRQDLIIRGGENISPIEIENRLFEHPEIAEVAIVGVDHPTLGQEVVAFVVPHTAGAITEADVQQWVAATLARFKVPSRVELRDDLPHNASGKVLKHVLASPDHASGFVEDESELVDFEELMGLALDEARAALSHDDVPVGALVVRVDDGSVLARRHNERELDGDPTAHAELLAITDAARERTGWRLDDCALVVTLEPCPMCAGAALAARIPLVVFGAADPKAGALGSLYHFGTDPRLHHGIEVRDGVRAAESAALLKEFFAGRRLQ